MRSGAPARLYVDSDYSLLVQNKNGSTVYSALTATERLSGVVVEVDATDVAFIQAGTGAVTRTAQAKMRDVVSVKDFGAVGDGVADDTAAIQAAINSGAKTILLPTGTYLVSSSIRLKTGQTITGDGRNATVINWRPTSDIVCIRNFTGAIYTTVLNLALNSISNANYAFQFDGSYANAIKNVFLGGTWDIGVLLHGTYVCQLDDIDTTGTFFKRYIVAVSKASNAHTIRKLHTSSYPSDSGITMTGIALEGGMAHNIIDCVLQGPTIGIYLAQTLSARIDNPYFENTICNIKTGDNTRESNSDATLITGGTYWAPYAYHPQYGSRGPIIFTPRSENVTLEGLGFEATGNAASATGPWPVLASTTTNRLAIIQCRHFASTARNLIMRDAAGANPSLTIIGSAYGVYNAQEVVLKADGVYGGWSAGIRVDSSGVVSASVFQPPVVSGTVSALIAAGMPSIAGLVQP
jgi:hypothetical protein